MLHARSDGETIGLAVAEFALRNKPVITFNGQLPGYARAHLEILGDSGLYYHDLASLFSVVDRLALHGVSERDWNVYSQYARKVIMPKFERMFIKPALDWWEEVGKIGIEDVWEVEYEDLPPLDKQCK